ncbi:hypothetical protein Taro_019900 [Colocasia esculenta]|uniref:Uncharacterized protein n=1 Tax=Colocasia esculenta TaxID=4460 RepID=A0A843V0K8_COLES|nr:hypothetical protein [Colocasia esculenta]
MEACRSLLRERDRTSLINAVKGASVSVLSGGLRVEAPVEELGSAWKCSSCRRGFGTRRADAARKKGPLTEQAIRYPEAALGSCWYPNAVTGLRSLRLFLKGRGAIRKGHICTLNWAGP